MPDKSEISTREVSTFSLKATVLFNIKVPVGCSFLITTSLIKSPSLSVSKSFRFLISNFTGASSCKNPVGILISVISYFPTGSDKGVIVIPFPSLSEL